MMDRYPGKVIIEGVVIEGFRDTPTYWQARQLLAEKAGLHERLREVNRLLRKLQALGTGEVTLARKDLDSRMQENLHRKAGRTISL